MGITNEEATENGLRKQQSGVQWKNEVEIQTYILMAHSLVMSTIEAKEQNNGDQDLGFVDFDGNIFQICNVRTDILSINLTDKLIDFL